MAEAFAQFSHLGFQIIDLRDLLTQLSELTFIGLGANLQQEELMME